MNGEEIFYERQMGGLRVSDRGVTIGKRHCPIESLKGYRLRVLWWPDLLWIILPLWPVVCLLWAFGLRWLTIETTEGDWHFQYFPNIWRPFTAAIDQALARRNAGGTQPTGGS